MFIFYRQETELRTNFHEILFALFDYIHEHLSEFPLLDRLFVNKVKGMLRSKVLNVSIYRLVKSYKWFIDYFKVTKQDLLTNEKEFKRALASPKSKITRMHVRTNRSESASSRAKVRQRTGTSYPVKRVNESVASFMPRSKFSVPRKSTTLSEHCNENWSLSMMLE